MRNKKLLTSFIIAFAGIIIYFLTIPTIDEEALVDLTVRAGDKGVLENIYFNGHLNDYSSFHINEEGVDTTKNLSYLKQEDVPNNPALAQLQNEYPEFTNHLLYSNTAWEHNILDSTKYLVGSYFEYDAQNNYFDTANLQLKAFNKETDTLIQEEVKRENYPEKGRAEILGMHEAYPVINILYSTSVHSGKNISEDSSILSMGEYNMETKTYSEHDILSEDGYFYCYTTQSPVSSNNGLQIIDHIQYENNGSEIGEQNWLVYNFEEATITLLDAADAYPMTTQSGQLFTLEHIEGETVLRHYNQNGEEILSEVSLDLQIPINFTDGYPTVMQIIDNKLYLVQSAVASYGDLVSEGVASTPLQVFDIESGETLLLGEFNFDTKNEVHAREGVIQGIGKNSDL